MNATETRSRYALELAHAIIHRTAVHRLPQTPSAQEALKNQIAGLLDELKGGATSERSPCNALEYIAENGQRYAWSDSNVQYEPVPEDGASFTLLRNRLKTAECRMKNALANLGRHTFNRQKAAYMLTCRPEELPPCV